MKKLVCESPGNLCILEEEDPEPVDGWVPIDIRAIGVCGTDYHLYGGRQPFVSYPRVMGHELSGTVGKYWAGDGFKPGQRVLIDPYISCGACTSCRLGKTNCCENIEVFGVHRDGGMCERLYAPPKNIIDASGLSFNQAAMVEFLSIGRHAVARTGCRGGASALVVGAGPIGLAAALYARIEGCYVTVADVSKERLNIIARNFSLSTLHVEPGTSIVDKHLSIDHVFDATGNIHAMNSGLSYVAHGGTYTLLSIVNDDIVFSDPEFHKKEVTLFASRNAIRADFQYVIESIRSGAIDTDKLMTHQTTLEGAVAEIPNWSSDRGTVIKAIIEIDA